MPPPSPDNRGKGEEGAGKNDLTGRGGGGFTLRWGLNFQGNSIFLCIHLITVTIFQLHFKLKVIFLTWVSLHAKLNTHYEGWKYKKKKKKKTRLQESYLQRAQRKNVSTNSRLEAIQIIDQRKAFYRQGIPESSCARKETIGIDILITQRNGDRKSYNVSK